jgi:hypothetical protein
LKSHSHDGIFTHSIDQDQEGGQGYSTDKYPEGDSQYWICQDREVNGSFLRFIDQDRVDEPQYSMEQDCEDRDGDSHRSTDRGRKVDSHCSTDSGCVAKSLIKF